VRQASWRHIGSLVILDLAGQLSQDEADRRAVRSFHVDREPICKFFFHREHERIFNLLHSSTRA